MSLSDTIRKSVSSGIKMSKTVAGRVIGEGTRDGWNKIQTVTGAVINEVYGQDYTPGQSVLVHVMGDGRGQLISTTSAVNTNIKEVWV